MVFHHLLSVFRKTAGMFLTSRLFFAVLIPISYNEFTFYLNIEKRP